MQFLLEIPRRKQLNAKMTQRTKAAEAPKMQKRQNVKS